MATNFQIWISFPPLTQTIHLAMMYFTWPILFLPLTHIAYQASTSPLQIVQASDPSERHILDLPIQYSNTSVPNLGLISRLNVSHDVHELRYAIPGTDPRRYLQMAYNRANPVDAAPFRTVVSTIWTATRNHIARHGDGPVESDPWTFGSPGCFSSTTSTSEPPSRFLTFGMLYDIMSVFRIMLEGKQSFFNVFYDLLDEHENPLAEGSLLQEEEPPYHLASSTETAETRLVGI